MPNILPEFLSGRKFYLPHINVHDHIPVYICNASDQFAENCFRIVHFKKND